ncbi:endonuclease V [Blastopirellula marina]|uniref:O6-methylguanine-DNA methyltransferase/endonuclease V n=1 Tax=Blastopirellula marina DSM 3645 TaxID=314230 RepID=A3ZYG4_9BACT|nr:endonuclease V [Blastopirellula marina]EAQ78414.1 O6-methylguanine-DNA methyltransferase/endonuclease V [Blastopirellula marina DSM 3645]
MTDFSQLEQQIQARLPDLPSDLQQRIAQIPLGKVATYGRIAQSLGDRLASRWIGDWLLRSPLATTIAAHRVVRAGGELGLFHTGSSVDKQRLLTAEGVAVVNDRVDLSEYEFSDFAGSAPLTDLREWQNQLAAQNRLNSLARRPELVAGLDISYHGDEGVVAYVLFDYGSRELVWSHLARRPVFFPYITSYLSYRELPLHLAVLAEAAQAHRLADVLLVDGSGVLHPRRCGIASMLSALTGLPTIGVTKKHLSGSFSANDLSTERFCDLRVASEDGSTKWGAAILPTKKTKRPIFVSPGGSVDFDDAEAICAHFMVGKRLPTPIAAADHLSRQAASGETNRGGRAREQ